MLAVILLSLIPALVSCAGDGNIRLLEEEVATAMRACVQPADNKDATAQRQRRSDEYPRTDSTDPGQNSYNHEPRNTSDQMHVLNSTDYDYAAAAQRQRRSDEYPRTDSTEAVQNSYYEPRNTSDQMHVLNSTDNDYAGYGTGSGGEKFVSSVPRPAGRYYGNSSETNGNRTKRSEPLLNKPDSDQCLSQCIFANLQIVDSRGIPREAELWSKVQSSVTSQQSRAALRDQIRACFQELQSEAEDNGCSYSNKLECCLMLRFSDRKMDGGTAAPATSQKT